MWTDRSPPTTRAVRVLVHVLFDFGDAIVRRGQAPTFFVSAFDQGMRQAFGRPAGSQQRRGVEKDDHLLINFTLAASSSSSFIHFLMVAAGMSRIGTVTAGCRKMPSGLSSARRMEWLLSSPSLRRSSMGKVRVPREEMAMAVFMQKY